VTSSLPVAIPDQLKGKGLRFTRLRPPVIGDKTTGKAPCDPSFYDEGALREDDPTLLSYVEAGNGFGMVGTFGNFIGFDADQGELLEEMGIMARLPPTLTDRAPHKPESLHLYCICKGLPQTFHFWHPSILVPEEEDEEGKIQPRKRLELGQVCAGRGHITGPGAPHWSGGRREIIDDSPLAEISIDDLKAILKGVVFSDDPTKNPSFEDAAGLVDTSQWDRLREMEVEARKARRGRGDDLSLSERIGDIRRVLSAYAWNPTVTSGDEWKGDVPGEYSKSKTALSVNVAEGLWYCHHHSDSGGDAAALVALFEGLINCRENDRLRESEIFAKVLTACEEKGLIDPDDDRRTDETEDDGIKSISEEELNGLNIATRPRLQNGLEDDHFISQYLEYGAATCDAFLEYHFSGALTLLSVAVGRKLVIKLKQGLIHPNIWSFNLGPSTISRKSTAIAKMEDMLKVVCPETAIPKSFSPEALIEHLSECPVSYLVKDEAAQLLASMKKQYMEDVRDFFSEIYDNRDFRRKLRTGKRKDKTDFQITDPYIVQSYATTNTLFREHTTTLDLTSGWLMRFLYFAPNYRKPSMAFEVETGAEAELYGRSLGRFSGLYRLFSQIEETEIEPEPKAMKFYQKWQLSTENALMEENDGEISLSLFGRLQVYALKLAVLFTVGRRGYKVGDKISLAYMQEAVRQVDEYFLPVGRSVVLEVGRSEQTNLQNQIIGTLERCGGKMKRPDLLRSLHQKLKDVADALAALVESGEIEARKVDRPGKKSVIWYILLDSSHNSNNSNNSNNRNNRTDSSIDPGIEGTTAIIATNAIIATEGIKGGEELAGEMPEPSDEYETIAENLEEAARREAAYLEKFKTPEPKTKPKRFDVIYEPKGPAREYSAWACNLVQSPKRNGEGPKTCSHGCLYCYNPKGTEDGPILKRDVISRLKTDLPKLKKVIKPGEELEFTFVGDIYDPKLPGVARECLQACKDAGIPFRVLTKNGSAAIEDFDLYRPGDIFGCTLTLLDHEKSKTWEPGAALPEDRLRALEEAHKRGIETWASLEPVIDPAETLELIRRSHGFVDHFKVGKWNHDKRADSIDWRKFAVEVVELLDSLGCDYYIKDDLKPFLPAERARTKKEGERSPPKKTDPPEEEVKPSLTLAGFKEIFQRRGLEEITAPILASDQGITPPAAKVQLDRAVKWYGLIKWRLGLDDYYRLPEEVST
jgi:hypothetical protein